MPRPVENDDFCQFMSGLKPGPSLPCQLPVCTNFDIEEDKCALEACMYSKKWFKWFEYMEALD